MFQKKYILSFLLFSILFIPAIKSQFYNLPGDYQFSLLTERALAAKDSSIHSGIKPYIPFFSKKYVYVGDTHVVFKYITDDPAIDLIFYKHLLQVKPKMRILLYALIHY